MRTHSKIRWLLSIVLFLGFLCPAIASFPEDPSYKEQKRAVLYLYRSDFGETADDNDGIHIWEPVVSLLGLELDIVDTLSASFPGEERMNAYCGIIAPTGAWETSLKWCRWLTSQVRDHDRMVLVIAPLGPGDPDEEDDINQDYKTVADEHLNELYSSIGISINSSLNIEAGEGGESLITIASIAEEFFNFEEDLTKAKTPYFLKMTSTDREVKSYLTLKWKDVPDTDGLAVCSTSHGGFAIEEYIKRQDFELENHFWYINPLKFLISVFRLRNLPVPEPSRLGGCRNLAVFVEKAQDSSSQASYGQFVGSAQKDGIPLVELPSIPDIDDDIEHRQGVYSVVIDKRNIKLGSLFTDFESTIEKMALQVFAGKLVRDYRLRVFFDQNVFDSSDTSEKAVELLQVIRDSEFAPGNHERIEMAENDGHNLRHGVTADDRYFLSDNGSLRQVRSIEGDGYPDLQACSNIIGYLKGGGRLLLHLGSDPVTHLKLTSREPEQVYLSRFNRFVSSFSFDKFRWVVSVNGPSGGFVEVKGLRPSEKYICEFFKEGRQNLFEEAAVVAKVDGTVRIPLHGKGIRRLEFWSDSQNNYWFVKIRRFFWATGTLPLFIILLFAGGFFVVWKLTKLIL